mgnify:FL=1
MRYLDANGAVEITVIWEAYYYFVPEHVVMKLDILLRGKESVYWNPADESVEELNNAVKPGTCFSN